MAIILKQYTHVVLDITLHTNLFPEELRCQFSSASFLTAQTYACCLDFFKETLSADESKTLEANLDSLSGVRLEVFHQLVGVEQMLKQLSADARRSGRMCLFITSNEIQLQSILLQGLWLDIWDLKQNRFISHDQYAQIIRQDKIEFQTREDSPLEHVVTENFPHLMTESGSTVGLFSSGNEDWESGAEAVIYGITEDDTILAKILKTSSRTTGKARNIAAMQEVSREKPITWAMLPREKLYWDTAHKHLAGFTQPYAKDTTKIFATPLFLEFGAEWWPKDNPRLLGINLAIYLVRQVIYLNARGINVCDFNSNNFAVHIKLKDWLLMWDTDSFCKDDYYPKTVDPELTVSIRQFDRKSDSKLQALNLCLERLYAKVFWIVTLGECPLLDDGTFSNPEWKKIFVPDALWELFVQVFENQELPSADLLLYHLVAVRQSWMCEDPDMTYGDMMEPARGRPNPIAPDTNYDMGNHGDDGDEIISVPVKILPNDSGNVVEMPSESSQPTSQENVPFLDDTLLDHTGHFRNPRLMCVQLPPAQNSVTPGGRPRSDGSFHHRRPRIRKHKRPINTFAELTRPDSGRIPAGYYIPTFLLVFLLVFTAVAVTVWLVFFLDMSVLANLRSMLSQLWADIIRNLGEFRNKISELLTSLWQQFG